MGAREDYHLARVEALARKDVLQLLHLVARVRQLLVHVLVALRCICAADLQGRSTLISCVLAELSLRELSDLAESI